MKLPYALRNHTDQLVLVGISALAAGVGLGYSMAKRKYTKIMQTELVALPLAVMDSVEEQETGLKTTYVFPAEAVLSGPEVEYDDIPMDAVVAETLVRNVFGDPLPVWNYEHERSNRNSGQPYVINVEEFTADEMNFQQETLTYYEGDKVMVDSMDTPLYDFHGLMGDLHFGHGSGDPNVVYIRNEALHMEWEILRHTSTYALEVMGEAYSKNDDEELRHSIRRFRPE